MSTLPLEIEKALPSLEPDSARRFERAVRKLLLIARRNSSFGKSDFDRLAAAEVVLRGRMLREGRQFSASDRLTRDELHDRHALR